MGDTSLGSLSVGIGLDTAGLAAGMNQARSLLGGFGALAAGVVTEAAAIGTSFVKSAGNFNSGVLTFVTGAGEAQKNIGMVSDGILAMAPAVGETTKQLTDGMFMIESAGFHGAAGLDVLKNAAEGAKVGNADLASVANGVTTEMVDYASAHITAAQATNELIAAVAAGKTHMQDLANAESTVLPAAAAMGVGLTDVNAALATMTGEGTNAASAATYLRQLLTALEAPASKGAKALAAIGLTTTQVSDEMKVSLPDTLQMITDALAKKFPVGSAAYIDALKNIAGGSKQMQGILELTGSHLQTLKDNFAGITDAVNKGGNSITGFNLVQQDFNFKMAQAQAAIEVLGIKIGTKLLPVFSQLMGWVTPLISALGDKLVGAMDTLSPIVSQIGTAFHDVFEPVQGLGRAFTTLYTTAGKPLLDTFDRASSLLQKTSEVVKPLTDTFDRATAVLQGTGKAAAPLLDTFDRATALIPKVTTAANPFLGIMNDLKPVVTDVAGILHTAGDVIFHEVIPAIGGLAGKVWGIVTDFLSWDEKTHFIQNTIHDLGGFIVTVAGYIGNNLVPPIRSLIGHLEDWLTQSNFVHDSLQQLETIIGITSTVIGTLVGWVSDFIGGLEKGNPLAIGLGVAIATIGTAIAGVKLTEFVLGLQNAFTQAGGLGGILQDFVSSKIPNLTSALGLAKTAEEDVGTAAKTTMAAGVATGTQASKDWFTGLETSIAETEAAEVAVGTTAKTTMAGDIAAGATAAEGEIAAVGVEAAATKVEVAISTASMGSSFLAMAGPIGIIAAISIPLISAAGAGAADAMKKSIDFIKQQVLSAQQPFQTFADFTQTVMAQAAYQVQQKAIAATTGFSQSAQNLITSMGDAGKSIAANASQDTEYYFNTVAQMLDNLQLQANQTATQAYNAAHGIHPGEYRAAMQGSDVINPPGHAFGGINLPAGQSYLAGEGGFPELITPAGSTNVLNGQQTAAMMAAGGSEVHVHNHIYLDGRELSIPMAQHIVQSMRQRTGIRM